MNKKGGGGGERRILENINENGSKNLMSLYFVEKKRCSDTDNDSMAGMN